MMIPFALLLSGQSPPEPRTGPLPASLALILRYSQPRIHASDPLQMLIHNGGRKVLYGRNAGTDCEIRLFARRVEGGPIYAKANWAEGLPCRVVSACGVVIAKPGESVTVDWASAGSKLALSPGRYRVWAVSVHMGERLVSNALTVEFP